MTRTASVTDHDCEIAAVMAAIQAGDRSAVWRLRELADQPVRSRLRAELRRLGVRYDADDLDGMVVDAVLVIARLAGGWRPGGAPPWAWAHHRVVGVARTFGGTFARSLEGLASDTGDADDALGWLSGRTAVHAHDDGDATDPVDVADSLRTSLRRLAVDHPRARVLDAALAERVSARDAAVWLAVVGEQAVGNRHPALTVGAQFGLRADAVRKIVQRVRARLAETSTTERHPALAEIACLAAA